MSESERFNLIATKNGKSLKHPIQVTARITYSCLMQQFKRTTSKQFWIQFLDQDKWYLLNEKTFQPLLRSYKQKGQKINVRTDVIDNQKTQYLLKQYRTPQTNSRDNRPTFQNQSPQRLTSEIFHEQANNSDKNIYSQIRLSEKNYGQQGPNNQIDFPEIIKAIVHSITTIAQSHFQKSYKIVRQKEDAMDLGKKCCECQRENFQGPYFQCLVCEQEYILCADCEARDIHLYKSHPFAKIKRPSQAIKSKNVTTVTNVADFPPFEENQQRIGPSNKQKKETQKNSTMPQTEQDIANRFKRMFDSILKQLANRSQYKITLSNHEAINAINRARDEFIHRQETNSNDQGQQSVHANTNQSTFGVFQSGISSIEERN